MKASLLMLILSVAMVLSSCQREEELSLPPITQSGANTFGCRINGDIVVGGFPGNDMRLFTSQCYLNGGFRALDYCKTWRPDCDSVARWVFFMAQTKQEPSFALGMNQVRGPGRYYFNRAIRPMTNFGPPKGNFYSVFYRGEEYATDSLHTGYVDLSVADSTRNRLAGTFAFRAKSLVSDKVIDVADGRFDYQNCR